MQIYTWSIHHCSTHASESAIRYRTFSYQTQRDKWALCKELLKHGPVVLSFYRGGWCPYCNLESTALQHFLHEFECHGASLVALSPETPDNSLSTAEKLDLSFEVLSDVGNVVARHFGLVFQIPESIRMVYIQFGIDLPAQDGDASSELPAPATYVIDQSSTIVYRFVNRDYKQRSEPFDIVAALKQLSRN